MNRREGKKDCFAFCLRWLNKWAFAIAFAVQLPSAPWSITGGHWGRRSTLGGNAASTGWGAAYIWSRASGRSGTQPYCLTLRSIACLLCTRIVPLWQRFVTLKCIYSILCHMYTPYFAVEYNMHDTGKL